MNTYVSPINNVHVLLQFCEPYTWQLFLGEDLTVCERGVR